MITNNTGVDCARVLGVRPPGGPLRPQEDLSHLLHGQPLRGQHSRHICDFGQVGLSHVLHGQPLRGQHCRHIRYTGQVEFCHTFCSDSLYVDSIAVDCIAATSVTLDR
jgi:hypothetical protein